MKRLALILMLFASTAFGADDWAMRYPTGTALQVITPTTGASTYLKLDQTTHQHVINDYPRFDAGIGLVGNYGLYWRDVADANTIAYISYDGDLTMRAVTGDLKFVAGGGDIDFADDNILTTGTLGAGALTIDGNIVNLSDTTDEYVLAFDTATQTWRGVAGGAGGGASTALDNLAAVAINESLISDTDSTDDLGSSLKYWANVYTDKIYLDADSTIINTDVDAWNALVSWPGYGAFSDLTDYPVDAAGALTNNGAGALSWVAYLTAEVDGSTTNEIQNLFETIAVAGQDSVVADTSTDTLTLVGAGITAITTTAASDTITITSTEVDGSTTNEINTIQGDDDVATTGLAISIDGAGIITTDVIGDVLTITGTEVDSVYAAWLAGPPDISEFTNDLGYLTAEVDGSTTNEINTLTLPDANVTAGLGITFTQAGAMAITESAPDTVLFTVTESDPLSATKALGNLASVAINTTLISDTANTDDLGTEAIYWRKLYLASDISFEGATDDAYQTTLTATDTTLSDKTITLPDATGTVALTGAGVTQNWLTTGTLAAGAITGTQFLHDVNTYIDKDGSNNMIFVDAVTGSKTLAELAAGGGGSGDITSVGNVATGAAFDGTQGTTLTFYNAGGNATQVYNGTTMTFNKSITASGTGQSAFNEGLIVNEAGGAAATDDFRAETDTEANAFVVDASANQINIGVPVYLTNTVTGLLNQYQDKDVLLFAPDGIADEIPIFHVDADKYPNGIKLVNVQITRPSDGAYSMVFEEWAGDPPAAQNNIETVTTGAGDSYMEVTGANIDDSNIDADDYIFLHVPATDIDWIHCKVIFYAK
jgi:hypothetical protein